MPISYVPVQKKHTVAVHKTIHLVGVSREVKHLTKTLKGRQV